MYILFSPSLSVLLFNCEMHYHIRFCFFYHVFQRYFQSPMNEIKMFIFPSFAIKIYLSLYCCSFRMHIHMDLPIDWRYLGGSVMSFSKQRLSRICTYIEHAVIYNVCSPSWYSEHSYTRSANSKRFCLHRPNAGFHPFDHCFAGLDHVVHLLSIFASPLC